MDEGLFFLISLSLRIGPKPLSLVAAFWMVVLDGNIGALEQEPVAVGTNLA